MYVTEKSGYLPYDEASDTASEPFTIQDFKLEYTGNTIELQPNGDDILYTLYFDVYRNDAYVGSVAPAVQVVQSTQQQKLIASTLAFPEEDLFVVYRGTNDAGDFALDVRVNPMINLVWLGFGLLMAGAIIAMFTKRRNGVKPENPSATTQADIAKAETDTTEEPVTETDATEERQ